MSDDDRRASECAHVWVKAAHPDGTQMGAQFCHFCKVPECADDQRNSEHGVACEEFRLDGECSCPDKHDAVRDRETACLDQGLCTEEDPCPRCER